MLRLKDLEKHQLDTDDPWYDTLAGEAWAIDNSYQHKLVFTLGPPWFLEKIVLIYDIFFCKVTST